MFSPSIKHLIEEKSGSFLIPASRIAFVQADNPLYHAFLILTKVKYSKIPVLDKEKRVVGLLSLAMITDKMLTTDEISTAPLDKLKVEDVMQTKFDKINFIDSKTNKIVYSVPYTVSERKAGNSLRIDDNGKPGAIPFTRIIIKRK